MTQQSSPAHRRAFLRSIATLPIVALPIGAVAAVPVTAGAALVSDPVFQAMAALEQLKIHAKEPDAAHSVAEHAFFAARKENVVTLDGVEMRSHEQIDAHFTSAFGSEDEEQFNSFVERLRPRHLSDAERTEHDLPRQAAHDELTRQEAAIAEFEQRIGYREIKARKESAEGAVWGAEYEVMEGQPGDTGWRYCFAALRRRFDGNPLP